LGNRILIGRKQRVRIGGNYPKKSKVTSVVPQGSVFGPLLFPVCGNDIWRNNDSSVRLFVDSCRIYRKITNENSIEMLQKDLNKMGEWAVENGIKILPGNCKAIRFTRARDKIPLGYSLGDKKISGRKQI